ncbi:hypothetical protein T4D_6454 [Trichinella pseudospiralis]|uniref:Uncharacterized protein n=1 Tax=Trichinella pseudospiralis TaxID=6337 RepID=A0A0V1DRH3_TRIPS|nr:hypothetical protein T4D_6454 [Trichinella pseudospiralis]
MRNAHHRTWNMARQLTKLGKEKITWTWNMARNSEKREE